MIKVVRSNMLASLIELIIKNKNSLMVEPKNAETPGNDKQVNN